MLQNIHGHGMLAGGLRQVFAGDTTVGLHGIFTQTSGFGSGAAEHGYAVLRMVCQTLIRRALASPLPLRMSPTSRRQSCNCAVCHQHSGSHLSACTVASMCRDGEEVFMSTPGCGLFEIHMHFDHQNSRCSRALAACALQRAATSSIAVTIAHHATTINTCCALHCQ
jgi:hypothetical protein